MKYLTENTKSTYIKAVFAFLFFYSTTGYTASKEYQGTLTLINNTNEEKNFVLETCNFGPKSIEGDAYFIREGQETKNIEVSISPLQTLEFAKKYIRPEKDDCWNGVKYIGITTLETPGPSAGSKNRILFYTTAYSDNKGWHLETEVGDAERTTLETSYSSPDVAPFTEIVTIKP